MWIWNEGWTRSSGILEKTVQGEQFLSTNLGTGNAADLVEPGGNAQGKLAMQLSYSLLCLESLNKCFAILPFYISIPSQRNRREQEPQKNLAEKYLRCQPLLFGISTLTAAPPHTAGLSQNHCHWLVAPPAILTPLMAVVTLPPT